MKRAFQFTFNYVPVMDAEHLLRLAIRTVEKLFGSARVQREVKYRIDEQQCAIIVNAADEVGETLVHIFTNRMLHEFGNGSVQVIRLETIDSLEDCHADGQYKKRTCLKCNRLFNSAGPENRICGTCRRINSRLQISEAQLQMQRGAKRHNGELLE